MGSSGSESAGFGHLGAAPALANAAERDGGPSDDPAMHRAKERAAEILRGAAIARGEIEAPERPSVESNPVLRRAKVKAAEIIAAAAIARGEIAAPSAKRRQEKGAEA